MRQTLLFLFLFFASYAFAQSKNQSVGFKENKGQIIDQKGKPNPAVKYLLNTSGLNVQIKTNGFSYDIYETKKHPLTEKQKAKLRPSLHPETEKEKLPDYTLEYIYHRIDIDFVNSNPKVELITEQKSKDYDNYYNIPNKPEGVLMVHQYQQITYKNIYPNIDVVFSIPEDSLKAVEYNFVVHPKGKISDIQLKFNGAKTELVDNKIKIQVRFGKMEETLPMSWTEDGKGKKEIAVGYTKIKKNVYGFAIAENVSGKTVVIDPVPTRLWGTYYGGAQTDYVDEANNDLSGNLLITGNTFSRNNFTTAGAFIANHYSTQPSSFEPDGYIAKFDTSGYRIWGTYLNAFPYDIDVDSDNNIISSGYAYNFNTIGTPGTHKPTKVLYNHDGYVLKLDANGIRKWGTFYGDVGEDIINSAVIDVNNNIIVTGYTSSTSNMGTPGTHQASKIEYSKDVFLAKIDPNGNRIWGTYYGGTSDDTALSIAIDEKNNTYIVGETNSSDGIAFGSSHQKNIANNTIDGLIACFDSQGIIIFGTYYGGTNNEYFNKIDYNNQKILVSGKTFSKNGLSTSNAPFPNPFNIISNFDGGFFAVFSNKGSLEMGSYFEKVILDSGFDIYNNIFINGYTNKNGLGTLNSYQPNLFNNSQDTFLVKYGSDYSKVWGTYYGGSDVAYESVLHIDKVNSFIYLAGRTTDNNNMTSNNAYQPLINGREDLFIAKFQDCNLITTISSNSPICLGKTIELKASGGTTYAWTGPNGFTSTVQNPTINNASALNTGKYSCNITGTGGCDGVVDVDVFVGDNQPPVPNLATLPTISGDCKTIITTIPTATDACAGAITATTTSPLSYNLPGNYSIVWNYDDGNGNSIPQSQTVSISPQSLPTAISPQPFCIQQNATISSIVVKGQNIKWYDALTNGTLLANTALVQNGITYYASQTINGCESERVPVVINIQNTATPTAISPQTFCSSQNPTLKTIVITATAIKWYDSLIAGAILPDSTPLQDGKTYYAAQTVNGCESTTRLGITIALIATLPANNYDDFFCDDLNDGTETVDLSSYNAKVISNPSGYFFTYYNSISGAEKETVSDKITNFSSYKLVLGENKIYVRINSNTPCYAVAELKLMLYSKPNIIIQDIVPICENKEITIDAGAGFDHYLWSTGDKTQAITAKDPGSFSIRLTNDYGSFSCESTKNFEVKKSEKAIINSIETKDWTDNANTIIVNIAATGTTNYDYSIDGVNYQTSNQFSGLSSGKYTVWVRDQYGCEPATEEVYLLMYPKFFTPNGDGYNETWKIKFSDFETGLTVKIFDRYGKLIKNLSTNIDSWDGTYNGVQLPATDYWFVVTRANGQEYKGHFSLKR